MNARLLRVVSTLLLPLLAAACASRDTWQKPDQVIEALEIQPSQRVADLGSADGYFVWPLSEAIGPTGRVYAVDIDEEANAVVEARARDLGLLNVETVLCTADDSSLSEPVDLVFTCNTYHHLDDRVAYFDRLKRHLRPAARVAIVEYDDASWLRRLTGHCTPLATIQNEMEAAGYVLVERFAFLSKQSFLVFEMNGNRERSR